jgi:RimJ/RimL family protein N-acetyltransferase
MEKMPFRESMVVDVPATPAAPVITSDWRTGLPVLGSDAITLRELRVSDAPALMAMLSTQEVARFISPPPTTVEGYERFIMWTYAERQAGRYACFAVVPAGIQTAIGIIQVRQLGPSFELAEWGFAIGSAYWGTGLFSAAASLVLDFTFDVLGVHRLEARAAVRNARGNGALRKMGATCEGVLRRSFFRHGEHLDQNLWSIIESDWRALRGCGRTMH